MVYRFAFTLALAMTVELAAQDRGRAGGMAEGVGVHGHWTIEVRNPDGTLVKRHEFDNALTDEGDDMLAKVLTRKATPLFWNILLGGTLCYVQGQGTWCQIAQHAIQISDDLPGPTNLTVAVQFASGFTTLVLEGQLTATNPAGGLINAVATELWVCPPTVAPASPFQESSALCGATQLTHGTLTNHAFASSISVLPQQIVTVKVVLSFS